MKLEIIKNKGNKLILFFLGYSFLPSSLGHLKINPDYDLAIVYDYSDLNCDFLNDFKEKEIYLIAFSMGVWAANLSIKNLNIKKAVAVNGTPFGIDEKFGISKENFKKTLDNFDFENFKKLCFLSDLKRVNFDFNKDSFFELKNIYKNATIECKNNISWDKVIISKKDLIFPPNACEWFSCQKIYLNSPHFVFFKFDNFGEIFEV